MAPSPLADIKPTDLIQAASAAIQAVSALAVAVLTVFLWLLARRQTKLLSDSVAVAANSAEAARKSAEVAERTLIGTRRPLFKIGSTELEIRPPEGRRRFDEYTTTITFTNIGTEPAIIVDSAAQFVFCVDFRRLEIPRPDARPFDRVWAITDLEEKTLVPVDAVATLTVERLMNPEEGETPDRLRPPHGVLYVYGLIIYDDFMGFRRELGFTYGWDDEEKAFRRCNLEGVNYDRMIAPNTLPITYAEPALKSDAP